MVELNVNGKPLDLALKGAEIKYTKQVADIFDIAKVSSSYTNSFQVPKTNNNSQIFEGLGLVGDNSTIPYSKTEANYKNGGFDVIRSGWLNISETSDNYKLSIIDGMIDFFKAIENKNLGVDLDLINFEHKKDLPTVLASKDNPYYTYIFADFGGQNIGRIGGTTDFRILIDYQVPSFSVKKLFDLIFSTFGFTCESQRMLDFINDLWITYPTPPTYVDSALNLIATLNKGFYSTSKLVTLGDKTFAQFEQEFDTTTITEGSLIDNKIFQVPETSGYNIKIENEAYLLYKSSYGSEKYFPAKVEIKVNGETVIGFESDPYGSVERQLNIFLNANDNVTYLVYADILERGSETYSLRLNKIVHNSTKIEIKKVNQGEVSPTNAFKDFKITDFFKELLYRTGLIPQINAKNKVTFYHISELLDFGNAIDWSDKYVVRKKENYLRNSYAQKNYFKMKYNENEQENNNGVISVNNKNIEDEKTLAQSKLFSPLNENGFFLNRTADSIFVPSLKMYQSEVKETDSGIETNYKTLDNRFYFLRKNNIVDNLGLISYEIPANADVTNWNFASIDKTLLGQLVNENFSEYEKIFNNFRVHEIELHLSLIDFIQIDFTKPYYFKKENAYYILNKISFQEGETSIGEFIKINK